MGKFLRLTVVLVLLLLAVGLWQIIRFGSTEVEPSKAGQGVERQPAAEHTDYGEADCVVNQEGRQDVAILPNAEVGSATANFVAYQTAKSIDEVVAFYESEMVHQGWSANEGAVVEADEANLVYTKANDIAMVMIHQQDDETKVVISINNMNTDPG